MAATKKAANKHEARKEHIERVTHKPAPAKKAAKKAAKKSWPQSTEDRIERLEGRYTALIAKLRRHGVNVLGLEEEEPAGE